LFCPLPNIKRCSGHREALPILISGLKRLEYRGYDSAGVGLLQDGKLRVVKKQVRERGLRAYHHFQTLFFEC
jgi:glucosamine 6-phosphate synthetase-like amidotransferase/phosphosugar isomerase protein